MNFDIILADPPWFQNARNNPGSRYGAGVPYPTMRTEDICNIPVSGIAQDSSALFLWVTGPKLPDGIKVMESWGFRYVTIAFSWVKVNKLNRPKREMKEIISMMKGKIPIQFPNPRFGIGYYTASNVELCLLGVRGRMPVVSNFVSQVIVEPITVHSKKPKQTHTRIEQLFGDKKRIELFGRESVDGWEVLGNQIDGQDIVDAVRKLVES